MRCCNLKQFYFAGQLEMMWNQPMMMKHDGREDEKGKRREEREEERS